MNAKALVVALEKHFGMSLSIEEIYLDFNSFEKEGSQAFETWLTHIKGYSKLRRLSLASASVVIPMIPSLKVLTCLVELNLSGNKLDSAEGCKGILCRK